MRRAKLLGDRRFLDLVGIMLLNVRGMDGMFFGATSFNQPLNNWNVSKVTSIEVMFEEAVSFNQPLNKWDVSNVTNMDDMFKSAESFNQPLNKWDVSKRLRR